ncbi:hypothetical protein ACFWNC_13710 [Streptomyces sp. NPDC058369]|uniref:hypothetical protein n=1 Tax=Streptomyces sp. NPDC058369 TaxID=3346462 RepID=UPI003651413C
MPPVVIHPEEDLIADGQRQLAAARQRLRVLGTREIAVRLPERAGAEVQLVDDVVGGGEHEELAYSGVAVGVARAKEAADVAAREATAVALRLFDNDAALVSELLGVPAEELEREAKPVTAARAKEAIETLRARVERPRAARTRTPRASASPPPSERPDFTPDGPPADAG